MIFIFFVPRCLQLVVIFLRNTYGGSTAFSSDSVPSGATAFTVFTGSNHAQDYVLSIV